MSTPFINDRIKDLLIKAAKCFEEGYSPFETQWLSDNQVTADECINLSSMIGIILEGVAFSDEVTQMQILIQAAAGESLEPENIRASVKEIRTQHRLSKQKPANATITETTATKDK